MAWFCKPLKEAGSEQVPVGASLADPGERFPYFVCEILIVLYLMAQLNGGAATWPFNAIAYLPGWLGMAIVAGCIAFLVLITRKRRLFESLSPDRVQALLILLCIAAAFAVVMTISRPAYPALEGDGHIDDADVLGGRRLRLIIVSLIQRVFGLHRVDAAAVAWHGVGYAYIAGALALVACLEKVFWDRLMGLLYFATLPSVLNFIGYTDSYGTFFVLACAVLALLYVACKQRSFWYVVAAVPFFGLLAKSHYSFFLVLMFPAWYVAARILAKLRASDRAYMTVVTCGVVAFAVLATLHANGWKLAGACTLTRYIWQNDSPVVAITHPLLLVLSAIPAYVLFTASLLGRGASRFFRVREPVQAAALYGSMSILCGYYAVQLVAPKACFGILDFVCQGGCLGALFAVPLFVLLRESGWKQYLYCFVAVGVFFTVPSLLLHRGAPQPLQAHLESTLDGERSSYYHSLPPFVHVAMKYKDIAMTHPTNSPAYTQMKDLAYQTFLQGVQAKGYYARLAPLSLCYLISWQYSFGDTALGQASLLQLLGRWPENCATLLRDEPCLTTMDTRPLLNDIRTLAGNLATTAGKPIYTNIVAKSSELLAVYDRDLSAKKLLVGTWVSTNVVANGETSIETTEYFADGTMTASGHVDGPNGPRATHCSGQWSVGSGHLHVKVLTCDGPDLTPGQESWLRIISVNNDAAQYALPSDGSTITEYRLH